MFRCVMRSNFREPRRCHKTGAVFQPLASLHVVATFRRLLRRLAAAVPGADHTKLLWIALASGAACVGSAWAAPVVGLPPSASSPVLTLGQAEHELLRRNPALRRARAIREGLQHQAIAIAQLPDPELGLMALDVPVTTLSLAQGQNAMLSVGLSQHFPAFGQRAARGREWHHKSRAALYGILATRAQSLLALRTAWADALYGTRAIALLRRQQQLYSESVRAAGARLRAGTAPETDLLRARLEQLALANQISRARALETAALATVASLLVRPALPALDQAWPDLAPPPSLAAIEGGLPGNPLLRKADAGRQAAEDALAVARSGYYPTVTVFGSYGKTYYPGMPDQVTVGVNISLPLFTIDRQDQRRDAARADLTAARDAYQDRAARLLARTRTEFAHYLSIQEQLTQSRQQLLPTARAAFSAALASYGADQMRMSRVLQAQRTELRYSLAQLELRRDLLATQANLDYLATGRETYHE